MRPRYLSTRIRRALTIWVLELAIESAWPLLALRLGFGDQALCESHHRRLGVLDPGPPFSYPYPPKCVEGEFSEVNFCFTEFSRSSPREMATWHTNLAHMGDVPSACNPLTSRT